MRKIIFSGHAKDRIIEYGFSLKKLTNNFKYSRPVEPPKLTKVKNMLFHSGGFKKIIYKWFDGVLYTINKAPDGNNIIMTVTPKKKENVDFNVNRPPVVSKSKSRPKKVIYGPKK